MADSQFSAQAQRDIKRKLRILAEGAEHRNVSCTCRRFGISGDTFYRWKREYAAGGEAALVNSKPVPGKSQTKNTGRHRREDYPSQNDLSSGATPNRLVPGSIRRHQDLFDRRTRGVTPSRPQPTAEECQNPHCADHSL